eukprot:6200486-Pleurochrysis_carterae.AAC.1
MPPLSLCPHGQAWPFLCAEQRIDRASSSTVENATTRLQPPREPSLAACAWPASRPDPHARTRAHP